MKKAQLFYLFIQALELCFQKVLLGRGRPARYLYNWRSFGQPLCRIKIKDLELLSDDLSVYINEYPFWHSGFCSIKFPCKINT
jgi:hypothetical protein